MSRRSGISVATSILAVTLTGVLSSSAVGDPATARTDVHDHDHGPAPDRSPQAKRHGGELVRLVRESTRRYWDVAVAEADGYGLMFGCVSGGEWGAMGLHYVNMGLVGDGIVDARRPEIVIYEPLPNGGRRLIGADFLVFAEAWHANNTNTPELNGQLMHLIESPNRYGLPAFYTLHVWAWKPNPNGAFVNCHPNVSCEAFGGEAE